MALIDVLGALLTLLALSFLALSGYLAARTLLGERAGRDALALAVAWLTSSLSIALLIGLVLGAVGALRIDLALAGLALLVVVQLEAAKRAADPWGPARRLGERAWATAGERTALAILAVHAAGSELLRGLLRPPLSWDSLMYHLLLTATWLQERNLAPVFGPAPTNFYGFQPGNGSLWFWWWMAPSHGELYVNLASCAPWLLLGLAAGAVARELGAARSWPLAAFATALTPTILRFVAAEYVDLFVGAGIAAAALFALLWLDEPRWGTALLAGAGLGLAAGSKVLALPYVLAFAAAVPIAAFGAGIVGGWRVRAPQIAAAAAVAALLGGFWYARNASLGAGPLGLRCEGTAAAAEADRGEAPTLPRRNSVLDRLGEFVATNQLLDATLGVTRPQSLELGIGPQAFLLLPALGLPWLFPRGRRRATLLVWSQIAAQAFVWATVPYADKGTIFANLRYLDGAIALAFAGGVAALALRGVPARWLDGLALALAAQGLLQLHAEMPRGVRLVLVMVDLAVLALAVSPALRATVRARWRALAGVALVLLLAGAPILAAFRIDDRGRAFALDLAVHGTPIRSFAQAWTWLDRFGGDGTVALASSPQHYFVYPMMGPRLERKVIFASFDPAGRQNAAAYPGCDPRAEPDPAAWLDNLARQEVRWLYLLRYPGVPYLPEKDWADARPDLFALRYEDEGSRIYEVIGARQEPVESASP